MARPYVRVPLHSEGQSLEPYVFVKNGSTSPTGYLVDAWKIIQENLQFRSEYRVMRYPVGQKVVAAGQADVLLQPTVITSSDLNQMTFSRSILSIWYELFVKAAESQEAWHAYVGACSGGAWLAVAATLLLLVVARRLCPSSGGDRSFGSCFVSVVGSVTSQGLQGACSGGGAGASRLLSLVTLCAGLLLSSAYSAVLTSRLTVLVAPLPFRSLQEIPEVGTHALCVRMNNYAYLMFKESETASEAVPRWRAVLERRPCANVWKDEDVARVMCDEHVALLEVEAVAARAMLLRAANRSLSQSSCRLRRVDSVRYAQSSAAFQMRRGFPLAPLINNRIQRMNEAGVLRLLQRRWMGGLQLVGAGGSVQESGVPWAHYAALLRLYGAALLLSCALLLAEMMARQLTADTRRRGATVAMPNGASHAKMRRGVLSLPNTRLKTSETKNTH